MFAPDTEKLTGWPAIDPPGLVIVAVTVCVVPTVLVAVGGDKVRVGCATTIPPTIRRPPRAEDGELFHWLRMVPVAMSTWVTVPLPMSPVQNEVPSGSRFMANISLAPGIG